ncbi:MAG TPA: hypothetical protein VJB87_02420 [Candidatus Nanoarchaeia archaeon]|nr:hypothetical protein [Candidatus Nanoarchaeia archaeon]
MIPQVNFKVIEFKNMFSQINGFLSQNIKRLWDWSDVIFSQYPDLKARLEGIEDKEERYNICRDYFSEKYLEVKGELENNTTMFQKSWDSINNQVMEALSKVIEVDWPEKDKNITARVSMNPICPRFIKYRVFDLYYKFTAEKMREVAVHEIQHFLFFEKWKAVFPETKEEEFDNPYLVWHLSEIAAPVILGDKRIQEVIPQKDLHGYKEHQKVIIDGKTIIAHIQEIYDKKTSFEDFLRKSYDIVKKYENEIRAAK